MFLTETSQARTVLLPKKEPFYGGFQISFFSSGLAANLTEVRGSDFQFGILVVGFPETGTPCNRGSKNSTCVVVRLHCGPKKKIWFQIFNFEIQ